MMRATWGIPEVFRPVAKEHEQAEKTERLQKCVERKMRGLGYDILE